MGHSLIIGMTESGKTSLAKSLAAGYRQKGIKTIVLDPLGDPEWNADFQTRDKDEFLDVVKKSRSCALFCDESGETIGRYNDEMFWLATRARHYGHASHFISQRGSQIAKTVRDQCGTMYLFACSKDDAKILANEFNKDELLQANTLEKGHFFRVGRFSPVEKFRINLETKQVYKLESDNMGID